MSQQQAELGELGRDIIEKDSIENAQQLIGKEKIKRQSSCAEEIQEVCKKYGCELRVTNITITDDGRFMPQIQVIIID